MEFDSSNALLSDNVEIPLKNVVSELEDISLQLERIGNLLEKLLYVLKP